METTVAGTPVHYVEHGRGTPVLVLHGAGVDHREAVAAFEPGLAAAGEHRRIYPDLPGMGRTPADARLTSNDDVVDLLLGLADELIGPRPYLVAGHSYGAYLARGLADADPGRVAGLALVAPVGASTGEVPAHRVLTSRVDADRDLGPELAADYRGYFVLQTPETLERYRDRVAPARALVDEAGLLRIAAGWTLRDRGSTPETDERPVLVLAGRQDSTAGHAAAERLASRYPRASCAVLDRAGHALLHEQPRLAAALLAEWLERCDEAL